LGFVLGTNIDQLGISRQYETQNEHLPESLDYSSIDRLYDLLRKNYAGELSLEDLMLGLKQGLISATGDPFTEYLTAEEAEEFHSSLNGEFSGVGIEIGIRDDRLVVIAPIADTPADRAGLRAGDAIVAIGEEDATDMGLQTAVSKIRGEDGTEVTLTISREGEELQDITITRGLIEVPSVNSEMLENNIGYIKLNRFGSSTSSDFRRVAQDLIDQGATAIVLDMRNNPGGYFDAATGVASEFLETGEVIVEERRGDEVIATERARNNGSLVGLPVVVLVNGGSASSSEIVSGALGDHGVATIIGEQTFGKGSVQQLIEVGDGSMLRVTIANWYTPSGLNISESGVTPDEVVEMSQEDFAADLDPQLDRAIEILSN
ncbi:MAG: S41 family peptidase, partial [Candidatus Saccharimonadales bacterium]